MVSSNPATGTPVAWRIAKRCDSGACVQVGSIGAMVVVGDSKNPSGPILAYSRTAWKDFVEEVKRGGYDSFT